MTATEQTGSLGRGPITPQRDIGDARCKIDRLIRRNQLQPNTRIQFSEVAQDGRQNIGCYDSRRREANRAGDGSPATGGNGGKLVDVTGNLVNDGEQRVQIVGRHIA